VILLNEDYKDILRCLKSNNVEFLVVGAFALGAHGYPRATGDIDIWVWADVANARKVYKALADFGAPLRQIDVDTFATKDIIFQIGLAPRRIDIITQITGVDFKEAWQNRKEISVDGIEIPFISKGDLIKNKLATGRPKDEIDARQLLSE